MVGQDRQVHQAGVSDESEVKENYEAGSWNMSDDQLKGSCEQRSRRPMNMNENNDNYLARSSHPINFKDGTVQRVEFRPHFVYIQARLGQEDMNKARNSSDRLRHGCDMENGQEEK
jgi:hypothetical protein